MKPVLSVVSIGVSKFIDPDFNLTYAGKDATDMAKLMEQRNNAFGSTKVILVMNEDATRDNIYGSRAMVISLAGGAEYAFESPQWSNWVLTPFVLEGLKTGSTDKTRIKP